MLTELMRDEIRRLTTDVKSTDVVTWRLYISRSISKFNLHKFKLSKRLNVTPDKRFESYESSLKEIPLTELTAR